MLAKHCPGSGPVLHCRQGSANPQRSLRGRNPHCTTGFGAEPPFVLLSALWVQRDFSCLSVDLAECAPPGAGPASPRASQCPSVRQGTALPLCKAAQKAFCGGRARSWAGWRQPECYWKLKMGSFSPRFHTWPRSCAATEAQLLAVGGSRWREGAEIKPRKGVNFYSSCLILPQAAWKQMHELSQKQGTKPRCADEAIPGCTCSQPKSAACDTAEQEVRAIPSSPEDGCRWVRHCVGAEASRASALIAHIPNKQWGWGPAPPAC